MTPQPAGIAGHRWSRYFGERVTLAFQPMSSGDETDPRFPWVSAALSEDDAKVDEELEPTALPEARTGSESRDHVQADDVADYDDR